MITKDEFHNALRIIRSIDSDELGHPDWWPYFAQNPYLYFVRCSDHHSDVIWKVMVERGVEDREAERDAGIKAIQKSANWKDPQS